MRSAKFLTCALACLYSACFSSSVIADDIDIFFGGPDDVNVGRPNVLFVLDNSGSMGWDLDYNSSPSGNRPTRMEELQKAFAEVMGSASGINAGLMTLNGTRKLYPITNIDKSLDSADEEIPTNPVLNADGSEVVAGTVTLDANELTLEPATGAVPASVTKTYELDTNPNLVGQATWYYRTSYRILSDTTASELRIYRNRGLSLVFDEAQLNSGVTVKSAKLRLYPKGNTGSAGQTANLRIAVNDQANPQLYSNSTVYPSFTGNANFSLNDIYEAGGYLEFTGLEGLIQNLVDDHSDLNGVGLNLYLTGINWGAYYNFYGPSDGARAPELVVELDNFGGSGGGDLVALRFTDVPVPKGATIDSAVLELTSSSDTSNNLELEIQIENSGNSAALAESNLNFSARPKFNNVVLWTTSGNWSEGNSYDSPDISSLLTAATNHPSWCGNNAVTLLVKAKPGSSGVRNVYSQEGTGQGPRLRVSYKNDSSGCINPYVYRRVIKGPNDVYQGTSSSSTMYFSRDYLRVSSSYNAGIRFDNLPIKPGAQILDARLAMHLYTDSTGANLSIKLDDSSNSAEFSGSRNELKNRANAGIGPVSWSLDSGIDAGTQVVSPDFSSQLQQIINKSNWNSQQAISLIVQSSTSSSQYFTSYDGSPGQAPLLMLKVSEGSLDSTPSYTVRDKLVDIVNGMTDGGGTPIAPTMLDASNYYTGNSGDADWPNPMEFACQPNHLVLLTDGQANSSNSSTRSQIGAMIGNSNCSNDASIDGEKCVRSLSEWLGSTDHSSTLDEVNDITVHTIGFAMGANTAAKTFMRDLAQENQGCTDAEMDDWEANPDSASKNCGFYLPDKTSELVDAFAEIFNSINSVDSTFVSPGASVNQFNRSQHNNELYFSLFRPLANERWPGNLKRYALYGQSTTDVNVVDIYNVKAVDPDTGFFKDTARSFWSTATDGNDTEKGGVLSQLPAPDNRKLYTEIGGTLSQIVDSNTAITEAMLNAGSALERTELIKWARGFDAQDNPRNAIGDPLHSRPAIITYRCREWLDAQMRECKPGEGTGSSQTEHTENALVFGTNEGYMHVINTNAQSGAEYFAFMPQELLDNIKIWKSNPQISGNRRYGLDGSPTVWINDKNRNGVIYGGRDTTGTVLTELSTTQPNDGEFVYAYIGMRRGGKNYYGLDITDLSSPSMLWTIEGGQGEFTRLAQTWSRPIKTRVDIDGTVKDVLIFSGGYDDSQDQDDAATYNLYKGSYKTDSTGNAIYMVDAVTGALLWSASAPNDPGRTHNLTLNRMNYSIPGGVRVVDVYGNGLADQIFFADLGGQVWRLYINNGQSVANLVWAADSGTEASPTGDGASGADDGVVAYLGFPAGTTDVPTQRQDARRFYHAPDISVFRKNGTRYLAMAIGSGFHADPLSKISPETDDAFFLLTSNAVYNPDLSNSTVLSGKKVPTQTLLSMSNNNLKDVTGNLNGDPIGTDATVSNGGWYIRLNQKELVTAPSVTQEGTIYFNTYEPGVRSSSCNATTGLGRAYEIKLLNGDPANEVTTPSHNDRFSELKSGGLPPETIILKPDPNYDEICIGAECKTKERTPQTGRTFWREVE